MQTPAINYVAKDFTKGKEVFFTKTLYQGSKTPLTIFYVEEGLVAAGYFTSSKDFPKNLANAKEKRLECKIESMDLYALGTPFQHKVWQTLVKVPSGQTVSYQELANFAGYPSAIRAAASAVARNPLCPFIPCHRVIRTGGAIGQYAFGSDLKKELLKSEGYL